MITEIVYLNYDNKIDLLLKADGEVQSLDAVTRMTLSFDSTTIDSDNSPDAFDWDTGVTGKLVLALGEESISEGSYIAKLTVYDPDNENGIVWGYLKLVVKS